MAKKETKRPTLDQVIRDAVNVQARLMRECGAEIGFTLTFRPAAEPAKDDPAKKAKSSR